MPATPRLHYSRAAWTGRQMGLALGPAAIALALFLADFAGLGPAGGTAPAPAALAGLAGLAVVALLLCREGVTLDAEGRTVIRWWRRPFHRRQLVFYRKHLAAVLVESWEAEAEDMFSGRHLARHDLKLRTGAGQLLPLERHTDRAKAYAAAEALARLLRRPLVEVGPDEEEREVPLAAPAAAPARAAAAGELAAQLAERPETARAEVRRESGRLLVEFPPATSGKLVAQMAVFIAAAWLLLGPVILLLAWSRMELTPVVLITVGAVTLAGMIGTLIGIGLPFARAGRRRATLAVEGDSLRLECRVPLGRRLVLEARRNEIGELRRVPLNDRALATWVENCFGKQAILVRAGARQTLLGLGLEEEELVWLEELLRLQLGLAR